jgi:cell division protein FtsB
MKLKRKNQPNNQLQKKLIQGVLFVISLGLVLVFIFGDHGLLQLYKLNKEEKNIKVYISTLRNLREERYTEKNKLENDKKYLEKLAREKYLMSKPGEKVFKILPKDE